MFYENQPKEHKENYKKMLKIIGKLSRLFSEAKEPYLYYRLHENIFTKYFDVENNARSDDSADAYSKTGIGIGLKTWVGQDNQKVAEFGRLRPLYENLKDIELVNQIANYRNKRITTTMNSHGLNQMIYHIVKRVPYAMNIYEHSFDYIDIDNIVIDEKRGNDNNIYFSDGKHTYHFSTSKNTLYMIFDNMELLDSFDVEIYEDPYELLASLESEKDSKYSALIVAEKNDEEEEYEQICLRLYSTKKDGTKFVGEKSGLNQWNAGGRKRNPNELYIPYPVEDRKRTEGFFPPRDTYFDLRLPDGTWIVSKVCQADGKAIMSNPNAELGQWLLRTVFELPNNTVITYEMLKEFNVDCVIFTKLDECKYTINFGVIGTYEKFYGLEDSEAYLDNE